MRRKRLGAIRPTPRHGSPPMEVSEAVLEKEVSTMHRVCYSVAQDHCDSEHCPGPQDKVDHFRQIVISGNCEIPGPKPDSERLAGKSHHLRLCRVELVDSEEPNEQAKDEFDEDANEDECEDWNEGNLGVGKK